MVYKISDSALFFLYLILLISISLPSGSYDTVYWVACGFASTVLLVLALTLRLAYTKPIATNLITAMPFLLLMITQGVYVFLQANIELGEPVLSTMNLRGQPEWFSQTSNLNIVPSNMYDWLGKLVLVFCFFILGLLLVNSRMRIKLTINTIILIAVIHGIVGFAANYFNIQFFSARAIDGHFNVARGLFVNRNHFAALINYGLAMLMVAGFYHAYKGAFVAKGWRARLVDLIDFVLSNKLVWLSLVLALIIFMNFSTSRAAILGCFLSIALITMVAALIDRHLKQLIKPFVFTSIIILLLLIIIGAEVGIVSRLKEGGLSLGERHEQWAITLDIFRQYWVFGTGAGTYLEAFQYFRDNDALRQVTFNQSHSFYFQLLLEQGVIGFMLWLLGLVIVLMRFIKSFKQQESFYVRSVLLGVMIAMMMALLQSFVDFNLLIPALSVYFYTFIALGYAAISLYSSSDSEKQDSKKID